MNLLLATVACLSKAKLVEKGGNQSFSNYNSYMFGCLDHLFSRFKTVLLIFLFSPYTIFHKLW